LDRYFQKRESAEDLKIKQVSYSRKFNLGNYESEEIGFPVVVLEDFDTVDGSLEQLKGQVMRIHEKLKTLEPPEQAIPVTQQPSVPYGFDPTEFLDHEWKGKKREDGSYEKGSCGWGWDFLYADREHTEPNFSKVAISVLERGPVRIGDDYEVSLNESGSLVQIQKAKKSKKTRSQKEVSEPVSAPISEVESKFPEDLQGMLCFELTDEFVLIKPREYLGPDNFRRVAGIVRDRLAGEYLSLGKDSHFRVKREK